MRVRPNYKLPEVGLLVARFAALAVATQQRRSHLIESQLADLEIALSRIPEPLYEALTLRGLQRLSNVEAASAIGVHRNTMSRRYMKAIRWVSGYLNDSSELPALRAVIWRDWARANAEAVLGAVEDATRPGPGRPPKFPQAVDERVLELHCSGSTEREIVRVLSAELPRLDGREWTRSSVRSILRRYRAPKRSTGRRRQRGSYTTGDITKPDYREIEFGEPLCDPAELLRLNRRRV